jgi:hypothetical protein
VLTGIVNVVSASGADERLVMMVCGRGNDGLPVIVAWARYESAWDGAALATAPPGVALSLSSTKITASRNMLLKISSSAGAAEV